VKTVTEDAEMQTDEVEQTHQVSVPVRTIATQTVGKQSRESPAPKARKKDYAQLEMPIEETKRPSDTEAGRLTPEDVTRRLERLQSLTASLLED